MQREAKGVVALPTHGSLFIMFLRHRARVALKVIARFAVGILYSTSCFFSDLVISLSVWVFTVGRIRQGVANSFATVLERSWSHRIASTFLSRIDPAYLLAVADERRFNVDKGAGGDKERSKAFLFRLFYLFIFWEGTARCPARFAPSISVHNCRLPSKRLIWSE
jgi:hypothetical protein